ncbi:hypothetical protein AMATHDRAFT_4042 [Amanita thiersii Skay4041]|uniref:Uncharacterized protein n=1 Tax=Amanita thiersii Skay4041 TaxID=703135 RepID=A0A2A9NPZ9_9AGAR|nr:hypothetical protein AMATHDRAFT_4042 [Amanita thiersii Skay4041]
MRHRYFIWILGGEPLLNDSGWELSAEDRNHFMHALNGNHSTTDHKHIALVDDFKSSIIFVMQSLHGASQVTIDSFFEVQENHFLIWIFSESILETYRLTSPENSGTAWLMPSMETITASPPKDRQKNNKKQSLLILASFNASCSYSNISTKQQPY